MRREAATMAKLCKYCSIIVSLQSSPSASNQDSSESFDNDHHPIEHYSNVEKLIESANECSFCNVIRKFWTLQHLLERYPDIKQDKFGLLKLSLQLIKIGSCDPEVSCVLLHGEIEVPWHAFVGSFTVSITICSIGSKASQTSLWKGHDSSIKEKIETIKSWYTDCVSHHAECAPPIQQYPTRLVEIGAETSELRLVDTTKEATERSVYATLSYCWGPFRPFTASKSNLNSLFGRIPAESLPRTFREAIRIAWGLGIRYIWIDSLCIIQDDLDDWRREAARMKDVYAGSSITISASDAKNSMQGCFVDSIPELHDNPEIQVAPIMEVSSGISDLLIRLHQGDIRHRTMIPALSTRGWSMQEQLLSHRVVHCMRPEVHWNCHRNYHTESQTSFNGNEIKSRAPKFLPNYATTTELRELWWKWMRDYSSRNLTITNDRLSALTGIVQHYGDKTGFKHILGCWEETLVTDLLWMRVGDPADASMALPGIPSWSWLSRTKDANFDFWSRATCADQQCTVDDHVNIVEASVTWTGEPMVSDIAATKLIVEGPVKQIRLRADPKGATFRPPYMNVGDEEPDFSRNPLPWRCAAQFDLERTRQEGIYTCLLVRSVTSPEEPTRHKVRGTFLLLLPAPGSDGMTYQRIGIAAIRGIETGFSSAERKIINLI